MKKGCKRGIPLGIELNVLRRKGYLNESAPTFEDLLNYDPLVQTMRERTKRVTDAYCYSKDCFKISEGKSKKPKIKDKGTIWCPDCGCALIWKTSRI